MKRCTWPGGSSCSARIQGTFARSSRTRSPTHATYARRRSARWSSGCPPCSRTRCSPCPRVHVPEVMGLLDHLGGRPDKSAAVFELGEQLGVDYDRMTAVVRAAEQLGWVTTPGEVARLTPAGQSL